MRFGTEKILTLKIENLRLKARVGISEAERSLGREIVLNVWIDYDAREAIREDALDSAVDYRRLRDVILAVVTAKPFRLIETIAAEVVTALAADERLTAIRVQVDKPGALRLAESVSASLAWDRREKGSCGGGSDRS
jgi:D-erythro-7,8-dihydroneopterin triphosphate epimerase